jgi:hypothetical protein
MTVAGTARARDRMRMMTMPGAGSSRNFRMACGASSVIRSASSMMKTRRRDITGRSEAWRSSSRRASMRINGVPLGFFSGGVGTST